MSNLGLREEWATAVSYRILGLVARLGPAGGPFCRREGFCRDGAELLLLDTTNQALSVPS